MKNRKTLIIGIAIGLLLAVLVCIPLVIQQRHSQFENGKHQGEIFGQLDLWRMLDEHFGSPEESLSNVVTVISVKDGDIVVGQKDGVLTIATGH